MKKTVSLLALTIVPLMFTSVTNAAAAKASVEPVLPQSKIAVATPESSLQVFIKNLQKRFKNIDTTKIRTTPVKGLYEVVIGAKVYYFSEDARYLLEADIIDMHTRQNLTRPSQYKARLEVLASVGEENMIVFAAKNPKYVVTAFTDIDCGYCRKMHSEINDYNKLGITIRYLFFPRAGVNSASYKKAVSVWCADDRKKAFSDAKMGKAIAEKTCKNPVNNHMALVKQMEMTGTPALMFTDGNIILSYIPPAELLKILES